MREQVVLGQLKIVLKDITVSEELPHQFSTSLQVAPTPKREHLVIHPVLVVPIRALHVPLVALSVLRVTTVMRLEPLTVLSVLPDITVKKVVFAYEKFISHVLLTITSKHFFSIFQKF